MGTSNKQERNHKATRRALVTGTAVAAGSAVLGSALGSQAALASSVATNRAQSEPSGELNVSLPAPIVGLDALGAQGAEESTRVIARHVFDTLVVRDEETDDYLPVLATEWETPDDTQWVFTLRDDAVFHDGTPVTATDVQASLETMIEAGGPLAPLWDALESIDAPDDVTVEIITQTPLGTVLANLALLPIVPAAQVGEEGFFNQPVGSGPFRVESYQPDQEVVLEANADYWGTLPGVQTLRFREIPEVSARVTALVTGEIDFTYQLPPEQLGTIEEDENITIDAEESLRYYFVWLNAQTEALADARVRRAMIHALDLDTIMETLMPGAAVRMDSPIPTTVFGYAPQEQYAYDPELAMELLAEAGYPDGFETDMIWAPGSSPQDREIATAMFSYWEAIGVSVVDRQSERAQWLDDLLALNWEMDFQSNSVITADADYVLRRLYHSSANRTGYANDDLDNLLDEAAATVDQDARAALYADACQLIWEEAVGIYPFTLVQSFTYQNRVQGFVTTPGFPVFTDVTVSS